MNKAKLLTISADDIADACGAPVHKICRDRKNEVFDFGKLRSVSRYIEMMRAKKELKDGIRSDGL